MKVSAILDRIDLGDMALPEFQRGYVWGRDQVRGLMQSLYREYPVGSLLVWKTTASSTALKGADIDAEKVVSLLLDGQQRMTSLYGVMRGHPPTFFQGDARAFTDLYYDLRDETFEFYGPIKMKDDPLWVNVTELYKSGLAPWFQTFAQLGLDAETLGLYMARLNRIEAIASLDFHVEEITGDKDVDEVVEIFNRVNSGGTKLSKGDLALARICGRWPDARIRLREMLSQWDEAGYSFEMDWLLRCATAIATNQAPFSALKTIEVADFASSTDRAEKSIDFLLNLIGSRLGLDHNKVLGGRYALTMLSRVVDQAGGTIVDPVDQGKLLYWYVHQFLWGRYGGSTETMLARDLAEFEAGGLDGLIGELAQWRGELIVRPSDFDTSTTGSRFYAMMYLLSRVGGARDLITGLELSASMLGASSSLELHHVFPKARLYKEGYDRSEVNAVANYCFLTAGSNKVISDKNPAEYLAEIAEQHPGVLESQWIPMDPELWTIDRYADFLAARRELLAASAEALLSTLLAGDPTGIAPGGQVPVVSVENENNAELVELVQLAGELGLAAPYLNYEIVDEQSGEVLAIADAVWPGGAQFGLSQPLAFMLEPDEMMETRLGELGYRFYTERKKLDWYFEEITGIDLDGDGFTGEPD